MSATIEQPQPMQRPLHPGQGKRRGRKTARGRQVEPGAAEQISALLGDRPRRRDLLIEFLHLVQDSGRSLPGLWHPRDWPRARHRIPFAEYAPLQPGPVCPTRPPRTALPTTPGMAAIILTTDTTIILTIMLFL